MGDKCYELSNHLGNALTVVSDKNSTGRMGLHQMSFLFGTNDFDFRTLFAELATNNDVEFIPFILKDVGGIAELNQSDGIHPTPRGHEIIANTVWDYLMPLLKP